MKLSYRIAIGKYHTILVLGLLYGMCYGCAPQYKYNWGNYENDLYAYYRTAQTPEDHEAYMSKLLTLIQQAEGRGKPVPPGIYAEYGYGLYQTGKYKEAIQYFEKEESLWPEARPLMEHLILNVRSMMKKEENIPKVSN